VHANGRVLVMPRSQATDIKTLLDQLPAAIRNLP